jgi:ubiquinone/menaquinone biosynthesis C-methylase UbiE
MITENTTSAEYYQKVANYYDLDAGDFEERYWRNPVLQKIRQAFREEVKKHSFGNVLEIGCGTGLDVSHFASIYPERKIYGVDISPAMVAHATRKAHELGLGNLCIKVGTPESLPELFPGEKFDHVYVFFGALNTVADLRQVARALRERMKPDGTMVLTFVNKWYLADMLVHLLKFRFAQAFRRFRTIWGGYSDLKHLESRCLSPRDINRAFGDDFVVTHSRGYSILYPAWYRASWTYRLGRRISEALWNADRVLNHTPAWCLGEYALYSFRVRN